MGDEAAAFLRDLERCCRAHGVVQFEGGGYTTGALELDDVAVDRAAGEARAVREDGSKVTVEVARWVAPGAERSEP